MFTLDEEMPWTDLGKGVKRKVMAYNAEMMTVKVHFQQGAVGEPHQHIHTQQSYVLSGSFRYRVGEEERLLQAGDVCLIPSNVRHGCVCLEEGILIDVFNPAREDFLL